LARGASAKASDEQGVTALLAAIEYSVVARTREPALGLIRRLLSAGADLEARNAQGCSALLLLLGARQEPGVALPDELLGERVGLLLGAVFWWKLLAGHEVLLACETAAGSAGSSRRIQLMIGGYCLPFPPRRGYMRPN
jgi:hypothetical protein